MLDPVKTIKLIICLVVFFLTFMVIGGTIVWAVMHCGEVLPYHTFER